MALTQDDFRYVADLIYSNAAIVLDEKKDYLVEARLSRIVRSERFHNTAALVEALKKPGNKILLSRVIDAMTTNETSFFRDATPFEQLKTKVVPQFIKAREKEKQLNIWCAACSSGQEPYSVAMVLRSCFNDRSNWKIRLIASDLSEKVLARAKSGEYTQIEINRGLPEDMLKRHFQQQGSNWVVKDELREMVEFRKINLIESFSGLPKLDIVFLRNVLIYFDNSTKQAILEKLSRILKPDGLLFLGNSETTMHLSSDYVRRDTLQGSIYQLKQANSQQGHVGVTR
jgi:chemotaxis protein methyltransferase CheR